MAHDEIVEKVIHAKIHERQCQKKDICQRLRSSNGHKNSKLEASKLSLFDSFPIFLSLSFRAEYLAMFRGKCDCCRCLPLQPAVTPLETSSTQTDGL